MAFLAFILETGPVIQLRSPQMHQINSLLCFKVDLLCRGGFLSECELSLSSEETCMSPVPSGQGTLTLSARDYKRVFLEKKFMCSVYTLWLCCIPAVSENSLDPFFHRMVPQAHHRFWSNCFSLPIRWTVGIRLSGLSNFWRPVCVGNRHHARLDLE